MKQIDTASSQITKNIINKAKIVKLFQAKSGTIFVLNTLKISLIMDEMDKYLATSFSNDTNLYQNFLIAKGDGSLSIKLKNN